MAETKIVANRLDTTVPYIFSSLQLGDGAAGTPSHTFSSDSTTGMFKGATSTLSFATAGVEQWRIGGAGNLQAQGTGTVRSSDGGASTPSFSFASATALGLYKSATNSIGISTAGTKIAEFNTTGLTMSSSGGSGLRIYGAAGTHQWDIYLNGTNLRFSDNTTGGSVFFDNQILVAPGTAAAPGIAFSDESTTGFYSLGANRIGVSIAGAEVWAFTAGGDFGTASTGKILSGDGTASSPAYQFNADAHTGMYRAGTNNLGFSAGSTTYLNIGSTGAAGAIDSPAVGGFSNTINSPGNSAVFYAINTDSTNGSSSSQFVARTNAAGGDPSINFNIASTTNWTMGIDNSDSDALVITEGATLGGVNNRFRMPTGGQFQVGNGSASAPTYSFINNTNSGVFTDGAAVLLGVGGTSRVAFTTSDVRPQGSVNLGSSSAHWPLGLIDVIQFSDGSAGTPSISFSSNTNTGIYRTGSNTVGIAGNGTISAAFTDTGSNFYASGTELVDIRSTGIFPTTDNAISCGKSGNRWTAVWAVNGTIQTSHSSTKSNIQALDWKSLQIPAGVYYERDGRKWLGYLNDSLPDEGRPVNADGIVDTTANYEQAVIGVLCAVVQGLKDEISALKEKLGE